MLSGEPYPYVIPSGPIAHREFKHKYCSMSNLLGVVSKQLRTAMRLIYPNLKIVPFQLGVFTYTYYKKQGLSVHCVTQSLRASCLLGREVLARLQISLRKSETVCLRRNTERFPHNYRSTGNSMEFVQRTNCFTSYGLNYKIMENLNSSYDYAFGFCLWVEKMVFFLL